MQHQEPVVRPTNTQYERAHATVANELARAEAKAQALTAALGLPLAVLVALAPSRHLPPVATALVALGAAGLVAAMVMVLLVVRPRLDGQVRGSWLHWANCTADDLAADLTTEQLSSQVVILSQLARSKYKGLRRAIDTTIVALLVLAAAVVAVVLT
ncbi:hypothetical protein P3T27_007548 [Kitasatospora sp. MAA19]|uniref:Pycsar system effector family protein n=1 Tax=Kitasatospora sp. MAA19 TaxID=3035090 RepID=UPI002475C2DE|nr:Pycsar system effector family protein [Kitasatospora sp. MAA19]MDH6710797.1 hypothetical protein [Kitasatospora sp. MAA19]